MRSRSRLRLASRHITSWIFSSFTLLTISGCGSNVAPGQASVVIKPVDVQVRLPAGGNQSALALFNGEVALRVGDPVKTAFEIFPKPPGAYEGTDLPQQVGGKDYKALYWDSGPLSFGVILTDERVVMAQEITENATAKMVDDEVSVYRKAIYMVEPKTIVGTEASYWFWELGTQRLMICKATDYKSRITLTTALGDENMMNVLRMSPVFAAKDAEQASQLLEQRKSSP